MNQNKITLHKVMEFFKALKDDDITFENSYCGSYTDFYSKIHAVELISLRVKVDSQYINPDCVDTNNFTNVSIDSIRNVMIKNSSIEEKDIDGKIISLEGFLKINRSLFNPSEQKKLENLLERFRTFYSKILLEQTTNDKDIKIDRERFTDLFTNL